MARETLHNPSLDIYEKWKDAMEPSVGTGGAAYGASSTIANNKKTFARMITMGCTTRNSDLYGNELATGVMVQAEYFSTVGLNKLYELDEIGHAALIDMGFSRTFGPELVDNIDTNIKRLLSRYTMVYTGEPLGT